MRDETIVMMEADRRSLCVTIDNKQYKIKVKELLSTDETCQKMKDIDEIGNQNTIENIMKKMENKLNYRIYDLKKTSGSRCAVVYYQPKIHKQEISLRSIISTTNNYNYKLAKYLTTLLEKARTKLKSYIKDSSTFAKLIQQQKPQRNDLMLSLDVEPLFTNIPVHETIYLPIKIFMKKKQQDNECTKLNKKDFAYSI
ncbi:unnamed protein product [Rotaria sordida]|uniref:Reverse transcriptase domain-containing protein n=1 Tax=Rotaria sordida TaxID=392033 RepID=A0A814JYT0_9BILA|nr:unnamed protein product [Rotaria sordida]CAF1113224.1 unnamed protein product [Rotaria sordida]CAF3511186.1 unnamed protein product [Rotaria sordida]